MIIAFVVTVPVLVEVIIEATSVEVFVEDVEELVMNKQLKNSREGRCVPRMFWGPFLVDRMMGG